MTRQLTPRTRSLLTIGGWLVAAAAATTVGVVAVGAIGSGIAGTTAHPLSHSEVTRALATARTPTPVPSPSESPTATGAQGGSRVLGTKGGTVLARCSGGKVSLVSWSPAQGFETDDIRRGPARTASIKFESDRVEITVRVDCPSGAPTAHVATETRHG